MLARAYRRAAHIVGNRVAASATHVSCEDGTTVVYTLQAFPVVNRAQACESGAPTPTRATRQTRHGATALPRRHGGACGCECGYLIP
jgi:hypothetical protein